MSVCNILAHNEVGNVKLHKIYKDHQRMIYNYLYNLKLCLNEKQKTNGFYKANKSSLKYYMLRIKFNNWLILS
jgi:hypothetical protein